MATLLSVRNDYHEPDTTASNTQAATRELPSRFAGDSPFRQAEIAPPILLHSKPVHGTRYLTLSREHAEESVAPSVVNGVSLYGVLQMLHLERKTCIVEIASGQRFGTITLVNGELVDADVDGVEGEAAVYAILSWFQPQTTIMDGVSLFRHTVNLPMAHLLVESVRLQDEAASESGLVESRSYKFTGSARPSPDPVGRISDWNWLVETLVIGGATTAAIVRSQDESVLAVGNENGGLARTPTPDDLAELATFCRAARRWSRMIDTSVTELVMRIGDDQILIAPIDQTRQIFAYVAINANDSLEFVRGAIRSVVR